jgi:hypothetical protein
MADEAAGREAEAGQVAREGRGLGRHLRVSAHLRPVLGHRLQDSARLHHAVIKSI